MGAEIKLTFDEATLAAAEQQLARLSVFDRSKALHTALKRAGGVVAKRVRQILPAPGYPGDKPGLTPLRKTIATRVKAYDKATVVMVGPTIPGRIARASCRGWSRKGVVG